MSEGRNFGLQWRLTAIIMASSAAAALVALFVYLLLKELGFEQIPAVGFSIAAGFAVGLVGTVSGSLLSRSVKLRLWEAGRMAGRIADGDYLARLDVGQDDEVGWLEEQLNRMAEQLEIAIGSLRDLAEQNRILAEEAGRGAALEERMRLARDLHDTVNQQLFVLAMRTAAVKRKLEEAGLDRAPLIDEVGSLEELSRQAHSQIRELILQLRPVALDKEGLGAALKEYLQNSSAAEDWRLQYDVDTGIKASGALGETLFRITQEAINNISKHAKAERVYVSLQKEGSSIKLQIKDDGLGFDRKKVSKPTAVGLTGIRERVKSIGGELDILSTPGKGTQILVSVPDEGERENKQ